MNDIFKKRCIIAPSLISCADMGQLNESVKAMERAGIELLHVDILDGHFSPSMPIGFDTVRAARKVTDIPFDVHLMTEGNEYYVEELLKIGVQQIVFHLETEKHIDHMLNYIHSAGVRAGVALKPATPLTELEYILEKCDAVLLMLMNPGYADSKSEGQVPYASRKVGDLSRMISSRGLDTRIILDGRISRDNIAEFAPDDMADIYVCGSTCLDKTNLERSISELVNFRSSVIGEE